MGLVTVRVLAAAWRERAEARWSGVFIWRVVKLTEDEFGEQRLVVWYWVAKTDGIAEMS